MLQATNLQTHTVQPQPPSVPNDLLLALLPQLFQKVHGEPPKVPVSLSQPAEKTPLAPVQPEQQQPPAMSLNGVGMFSHQQALLNAMAEVQRQLQMQQQALELAAQQAATKRQQPQWMRSAFSSTVRSQTTTSTPPMLALAPPVGAAQRLPSAVSPLPPKKRRRLAGDDSVVVEKRQRCEEAGKRMLYSIPEAVKETAVASAEDEEIDVVGDDNDQGAFPQAINLHTLGSSARTWPLSRVNTVNE